MKKFIFLSVMALASMSLVSALPLRAQDSGTISIKDPAEFNAYQTATTQSDPKAKASALESFLANYPQSVVKPEVLDLLIDTYQGLGDSDKTLSTASRVLQADPNNLKAIIVSVLIKKKLGGQNGDAQTLDDAAALARKGLVAPKPANTSDDEWKKLTRAVYPLFHSAIALDDIVSKKDVKAGIDEYRQDLMLLAPEETKSGTGLNDTFQLAEAYAKLTPPDALNALWFYARALNFAPDSYKPVIEKKLDYWYNKYHGGLDGVDAVKSQAAATVFPPATLAVKPAPTPAEIVHKLIVETPDLTKLNLEDTEYVLANGVKEDADKLWAVLKDKATPVPGTVIEATASVIKVAVTGDAKEAKVADFIVRLKTPLAEKEIPAAGAVLGLQSKGQVELDGIYDTYTQIPATATTAQTAQIVLRDGVVVPEKKKTVPAHKPAAGHHA
jgi:hypothetical protein